MTPVIEMERIDFARVTFADGAASAEPEQDGDVLEALASHGLQDVSAPGAAHGGLMRHVLSSVGNGQGEDGQAPFLLVQDARARARFGTPSIRGGFAGFDPARMIHVLARNAAQGLWAMEEGVKAGLHVVGEIEGTPRALDFTATRRLEHFSQALGVTCMLVRLGPEAVTHGSSGARRRWRVSAEPSRADPYDPHAPGAPRWSLELTRARDRAPGRWLVEADHEAALPHRLRVVPALAAGDVDARPAKSGRAGGVVAFPAGRGRAAGAAA